MAATDAAPRATVPSDPYERWVQSLGIPIHRAYAIDDVRTVELGRWEERGCDAAILILAGQEGVQEARVTEIAPGATLPLFKLAIEEIVYVADGRGLATITGAPGSAPHTFEWGKHSLFMIPPNHSCQLTNARGDQPARLLHVNYLPFALASQPDPNFFLNNDWIDARILDGDANTGIFSQAQVVLSDNQLHMRNLWIGNFFPDMKAWDKLEAHRLRGAGGQGVFLRSRTGRGASMSVFPVGTYKMAHRHGPGFVIVIPDGEGFSIMWKPGGEQVVVPWHEGTIFCPPNQWFHQHFNVGTVPARYLKFAPPRIVSGTGWQEPLEQRQITYTNEEPWIREKFEAEIRARGISSEMPPEVYTDPSYEWAYAEDDD
jgi:oxalate decarboxylase/phosphoglucose isomerase-like protein (cupin superfamily)